MPLMNDKSWHIMAHNKRMHHAHKFLPLHFHVSVSFCFPGFFTTFAYGVAWQWDITRESYGTRTTSKQDHLFSFHISVLASFAHYVNFPHTPCWCNQDVGKINLFVSAVVPEWLHLHHNLFNMWLMRLRWSP